MVFATLAAIFSDGELDLPYEMGVEVGGCGKEG